MARRLLILNGLAILGVVLYHSASQGFVAMFWWPHRYLPVTSPNFDQMYSGSYWALRAIEQFTSFSVPAFLFTSGYLVTSAVGRDQSTVSWRYVRNRIVHLASPFLFWSCVTLLVDDFLFDQTYTLSDYLRRTVLGQATPAFYFIPLLWQFLLVSPWLIRLASSPWKILLFGAMFLQSGVQIAEYAVLVGFVSPDNLIVDTLTRGWFFAGHSFWFVFGIVVGVRFKSFSVPLKRFRWILLVVCLVLLLLSMWEWEALLKASGQAWLAPKQTLLDSLYSAALILCFLAFDQSVFPLTKLFMSLGNKSYGIYLVHSLALTFASKAIYFLAPWMLAWQVLFQPLIVLAGLILPLSLMAAVNNSPARSVYKYQFG